MVELIGSIITALAPSIIVGLVLFYWERTQKNRDSEEDLKEHELAESELVRIELEVATAQLSYAVAMAYKRGHANGEMEGAIERYEDAMDRFREFERKQLASANKY